MSVLLADELPQDAAGAELVLGSHVEHKGEIDAREASFLSFKSKGEELIAAGHYAKNEVGRYVGVCSYGRTTHRGRSKVVNLLGLYVYEQGDFT